MRRVVDGVYVLHDAMAKAMLSTQQAQQGTPEPSQRERLTCAASGCVYAQEVPDAED